jgi:hypothetical protein
MEINVVDVSDRALLKPALQLQRLGQTVIESNRTVSNAVGVMVKDVISAAGCQGSISVLRIYSHGNEGIFNIAGGVISGEDDGNAIAVSNIKQLEPDLSRLAPYFAPQARVELQGCLVGKGTDGEKLLSELARLWHVRVQATTSETSVAAVQFTGSVVEAHPSGGLTCAPATPISVEKTKR